MLLNSRGLCPKVGEGLVHAGTSEHDGILRRGRTQREFTRVCHRVSTSGELTGQLKSQN